MRSVLRRRAGLWIAVIAALAIPVAIACGGDDSTSKPAATVAVGAGTVQPTAVPVTETVKVQLDWVENIQHFGMTYADKQGYYKDAHLNVKLEPGGQGIDGIQIVGAGAADVAFGSPASIMTAVSKGIPVVAFAAINQKSASSIVCRGDKNISKVTDLAGKTFGSKGPNDDETLPLFFSKNGIDPKSVKINPIGASSITELIAGVVDCQLAFATNEPITVEKAGIKPVIFILSDYGFPSQGEVLITNKDFLAKHSDALVRFLQATTKAWNYYLDNPEASADFVIKSKLVDGLDPEQQKQQAIRQVPLFTDANTKEHGLMYLNTDTWKLVAQQILTQKRVDRLVNIDDALTLSVLDKAALPKR